MPGAGIAAFEIPGPHDRAAHSDRAGQTLSYFYFYTSGEVSVSGGVALSPISRSESPPDYPIRDIENNRDTDRDRYRHGYRPSPALFHPNVRFRPFARPRVLGSVTGGLLTCTPCDAIFSGPPVVMGRDLRTFLHERPCVDRVVSHPWADKTLDCTLQLCPIPLLC